MFRKLRQDSQLRLLTALGFSTAALILCFGIYRLLDGEMLAATLDAAVATSICIVVEIGRAHV